jgi:hypothetical protein
MNNRTRPMQAAIFSLLLFASGLFMAWLGTMANAYFVPAACLVLHAIVLWRGRGLRYFEGVMLANQVSGLVLVAVLWLGDGLGDLKLDIAGVMLLANLLCGGPLMSVLAVPLLGALRFGNALQGWFRAPRAAEA